MNQRADSTLSMEPTLDLATIATIVRDLLAGGPARLADGHWLQARTEAAGLDAIACQALEALRIRLLKGGEMLAHAATVVKW